MNVEKAKEFMIKKHAGQKRIQGTPYYLHPIAVAEMLASKGYGSDYQVVGLFHDLLEDTDATRQELLEFSTPEIIEAVELVTKEKNYQMATYIERIKNNELAKMAKIADRVHNLQEANFASIKWIQRYVLETKQWYSELAQDTPFEQELIQLVKLLDTESECS